MLTRTCARCQESKTIRGVWYVVGPREGAVPNFVCESCYVTRVAIPA